MGPEDESSHAEALRSFGIRLDVIDIDGFVGVHFTGAKGFRVDERIRLTGANAEGIDANRKVPEEGETRFCIGHVNSVGIGEQSEAVFLGKLFEKMLRLDRFGRQGAIPSLCKLFESERAAETLTEMEVPVFWRDPAFLPIWPTGIVFDGGPDLLRSEPKVRGKPSHGAVNIHPDEDTADVEDNGAEVRGRHCLLFLRRWCRRGPSGTQQADYHRKNGKQNHNRNHVVNALRDVGN